MSTLELIRLCNAMEGLSDESSETAVEEIDLLGDKEEAKKFGGAAELGRGRHPFACANIFGDGECGTVRGKASFYYTPLGMLVCAKVVGLGKNKGVYFLSVSEDGEGDGRISMQCAIPPLYERGGNAWCSALTGKISPCELLGKCITLREMKYGGKIATGRIRCARG